MAGQAEIDAVPHAREFRMMVDLLGVQRDAGEEAERLAEILELDRAGQRLAAVLERPSFGRFHTHLLAVIASPEGAWQSRTTIAQSIGYEAARRLHHGQPPQRHALHWSDGAPRSSRMAASRRHHERLHEEIWLQDARLV